MIRFLIFTCICLFTARVSAQVVHFTTDDGLPSNRVYGIIIDSKGFLWCTTDKGVAMYNGDEFTNFTTENGLPVNDLYNIIPTQDGKVWYFGKSNELGYIQHGKIHKFSSQDGAIMNPTEFIVSGNQVGFYHRFCTYYLEEGKWVKKCLPETLQEEMDEILRLKLALFSNLLKDVFITYNGVELVHYNGEFKVMNRVPIREEAWHHRKLNRGVFFGDDLFYMATFQHLYVYNYKTYQLSIINWNGIVENENTHYLGYFFENGHIGVTGSRGKYLIDGEKLVPEALPDSNLRGKNIMGMYRDFGGNTWVNTRNDGIYKIPLHLHIKTYFKDKSVQRIRFFKGDLYAAVEEEGLYRISHHNGAITGWPDPIFYCYHLRNQQDTVMEILTNKTHYLFDGKHIDSLTFILKKGLLSQGGKDVGTWNDTIFLASSYDLWIVRQQPRQLITKIEGMGMFTVHKYNEQVLIGTSNGVKRLVNGELIDITGIPKVSVKCMTQWNRYLVMGTDGKGLFFYNGRRSIKIPYLRNIVINYLYVDGDNRLWIASNFGAHVISYEPSTGKISMSSIFKSQGIISNDVNDLQVKNDTLYCATDKGLCVLNINRIRYDIKPGIIIKNIQVNDSSYAFTNDTLRVRSKKNNRVSLSFDIGFLSEHEQLKVYYKIQPLHSDWIETNSKELNLNGLRPGQYQLCIKAEGFNHSEDLATVYITILPRWHELLYIRVMGIILLALIFITIVFFISLYINRSVRKRYAIQKKMVDIELDALRSKLNPHFIFNVLSSIQLHINKNDMEASEHALLLFSSHIRNVFDYSHQKYLSIEKEINLMKDYLSLETMRFKDRIAWSIEVDPAINAGNTFIPSMLLQPYVENAIKHGFQQKKKDAVLTVRFIYLSETSYQVLIIDNGKGMQEKNQERRSSTSLLDDRITLLNQSGEWTIKKEVFDSTPQLEEKGTTISIIIKRLKTGI